VSRVFVDTSALITVLDRSDPRHEAARVCLAGLSDAELVTHGYVVAESLAVVRRRFGVAGAITLLDDVLPAIDVLVVNSAVHASAAARYRASLPEGTSFVDQVTIELMSAEAIETAFVFDSDFESAGINLIP
jgi:uncharacterized protein